MFALNITLYETGSKNIVNDIYTYIKIELSNIKLNYFQQPVLRLIDYINESILEVLTFDYKTPDNVKNDPMEALKMLEKPKFTDMSIRLIEPKLILKALPLCKERVEATISEIIINNFHEKNFKRTNSPEKLPYVWNDIMLIQIKSMSLAFYKDEKPEPNSFWTPNFNFYINIERCLYYLQYMACFGSKGRF